MKYKYLQPVQVYDEPGAGKLFRLLLRRTLVRWQYLQLFTGTTSFTCKSLSIRSL